jgi:hypothetical protein
MNRHSYILLSLLGLLLLSLLWIWKHTPTQQLSEGQRSPPVAVSGTSSGSAELVAPPDVSRELAAQEKKGSSHITKQEPASTRPAQVDLKDYEKLTLQELVKERKRLRDELDKVTSPMIDARREAGKTEMISPPGEFTYQSRKEDRVEIFSIQSIPNRGVFRTALPRDEYPEQYKVQDLILGLNGLVLAKEHEAAAQESQSNR